MNESLNMINVTSKLNRDCANAQLRAHVCATAAKRDINTGQKICKRNLFSLSNVTVRIQANLTWPLETRRKHTTKDL